MATPMPSKEKTYLDGKRIVVSVPVEVGFLLDLIARYRSVTKKSVHEEIWRAGVRAHLGVDVDDIDAPSPLPRGAAVPGDIKKLTAELLGF